MSKRLRVALFYPVNLGAGWYACGGYRAALARMGHDVIDCPLPGNQVRWVEQVRRALPTIEKLNSCDVVLSTYHEYVQPWLKEIYGWDAWARLKTPVVARFDESMDRDDLGLSARMGELLQWADQWSFPTCQDARRYQGEWIPYGADTGMFSPIPGGRTASGADRIYDLAFIGTMYPSRVQYLERLSQQISDNVTFLCGPVVVQDLGGIDLIGSTGLLAKNYRRIKVFFCLPGIASMILAKVFDVLACGTFVMAPKLYGEATENMTLFDDGVHVVYYDVGHMVENARQIKYWLEHDDERETIASAGRDRVFDQYTIKKMLNLMLAQAERGKRGAHEPSFTGRDERVVVI